jgi:DNA-binding transcriptional regulator GbsR (MarR family)
MATEGLLKRLYAVMLGGEEYTLDQLSVMLGADTPSISARIRDLRKWKYGANTIVRRHLGDRVYGYSLRPNFFGEPFE